MYKWYFSRTFSNLLLFSVNAVLLFLYVFVSSCCRLHQEIVDFHAYISPTREECEVRNALVNKMRALIREEWPVAKLEVFGSFRTGLYLPTRLEALVCFLLISNIHHCL